MVNHSLFMVLVTLGPLVTFKNKTQVKKASRPLRDAPTGHQSRQTWLKGLSLTKVYPTPRKPFPSQATHTAPFQPPTGSPFIPVVPIISGDASKQGTLSYTGSLFQGLPTPPSAPQLSCAHAFCPWVLREPLLSPGSWGHIEGLCYTGKASNPGVAWTDRTVWCWGTRGTASGLAHSPQDCEHFGARAMSYLPLFPCAWHVQVFKEQKRLTVTQWQ
jgi:hypothetical protein